MRQSPFNKGLATFFLALLIACIPDNVLADVTGRWSCHFDFGGDDFPQDFSMTESGGSISGQELNAGTNTPFATITGTISGSTIHLEFDYISSSYAATADGTVSGNSMSGNWASNSAQTGTFSCTRTSNTPVDGGPTPTPIPGEKRPTKISLFCNRSGVGLEMAVCSATVADAGPQPLSLPTGTIDFTASDGFFPESAQCLPTQTAFSPGIAACQATFQVPDGFTIGAKFPINATYSGDSHFESSSTSHTLIVPGCIGTPDKPCPNSIGLSFDTYPQLLKDKLASLITCGSGNSTTAAKFRTLTLAAEENPGGTCTVNTYLGIDVGELFKSLTFDEAKSIGDQIDEKDAKKDTLLQYLKQADAVQSEERWKLMRETQEAIFQIQQDINSNRVRSKEQIRERWVQLIQSAKIARKSNSNNALKSTTLNFQIKADQQKRVNYKLPKRLKTLVAVMKKAGISIIPLEITLKVKQKQRKGSATISESVNVAID